MNDQRLSVLAEAIVWGNAYFRPNVGLAVASNGQAYTVSNLHYAASLIEAVSEGRDVDLAEETARARASSILTKILKPIALPRNAKRKTRSKPRVFVPRIYGSRTAGLPEWRVAGEVISVLVFLSRHGGQLGLSRAVTAEIKRALLTIVDGQGQRPEAPTARRRQSVKSVRAEPNTAELELRKFEASLPDEYHWYQSILKLPDFDQVDLACRWPLPAAAQERCLPPLTPCVERCCLVAARGSSARTVFTRFYKGDWKPRYGRMLPVVLVGGWQVQTSSHAGGPGFTQESSFSVHPPAFSPSPGEGKHDYPPPLVVLEPHLSPYKQFPGLATKLREAGYDHVRFSQSHPGDEIQISVDELYGVIDKTMELYGVDQVILIGHSRGGLISRKCIVDRWTSREAVDVHKLITYGSPHLGAQLADIGEDIILNLSLSLLPVIGPFIESMLVLIGMIPGVGTAIKEHVESQMINLLAAQLPAHLDYIRAFLESGEELKTTANFILELNAAYSEPVVPVGGTLVPLWDAIDHVLIAGTSPTWLKLYLGSWVPTFTPAAIAEELIPSVEWESHTVWDGVRVYYPHVYWLFDWTWHQVLDAFPDMTADIDVLASALTGEPTEVLAFHPGLGDSVVEKRSALATGVKGKIRRAEFRLEHFNLKANDEVHTQYEAPSGQHVTVNPWQLLFEELGLPFDHVSACGQSNAGLR